MLQLFIIAAPILAIYGLADSTPDLVKGKIYLKGDAAWVRVDFPHSLTNPLVFLGSPDYIGDYAIVPQVGEVDANGFTARVMVPSCVTADLSRTRISVPYIAWHKTAGQDYFADFALLARPENSPTIENHTYTFSVEDWHRISSNYVVLTQIQNMAAIAEKATEFNVTPYVHAIGSVASAGDKYTISLSTSISTYSPTVVVAIMALGASLPTHFGGVDIELKPETMITSGNEFSHSLASPVLAFIQPYSVPASHSYAVVSSSNASCVPRIIKDCQSSATLNEAASSYLLIAHAEDSLVRKNMGPNCWKAQSTSPDLLPFCELTCNTMWSQHKEKYMNCADPMECFKTDLSTQSAIVDAWESLFDDLLAQELSTGCSFATRPSSSPPEQYTSGHTWNTEGSCNGGAVQLVQVLFSDEFVLTGKLSETPSCGIQDITDLITKFCQEQASSDSAACEVTTEAFASASPSSLCGAALNPSILMRFNCNQGLSEPFCLAARPTESTYKHTGACNCPSGRPKCNVQKAFKDTDWRASLPEGLKIVVDARIAYKTTEKQFSIVDTTLECLSDDLYILCDGKLCDLKAFVFMPAEEKKTVSDGGPQCTDLSDQTVDTLEGAVCRNLCLDLWDQFKDKALAEPSPHETFVALMKQWHADNPWVLTSSLSALANNCTYEKRPYFSPVSQYDHLSVFDLEGGALVVHDLCPDTHFADIAGATFGCKSMIVDEEEKRSCQAYDATSVVQGACASPNLTQCTISRGAFPPALELCPSCDAFSLVIFYSCKLREESLGGFGISVQALSGSISYSGSIPSCSCTEGSIPATQEEITALPSWQASVTPPQSFVLGGARGVSIDESGNVAFSIWAPSSEQDCLSDFVKILCKHPVEGDPDEGMMAPNTYKAKFKTCGCADDPTMEPCTESEVKMLAHDWTGYFKDHYLGKSGVILLRNMRVMEDSGSIYTDFGVTGESACGDASAYKGIFCRVSTTVTSGTQTGLLPNCDEAVSLNRAEVSDYKCAYWCHSIHNNCKATQPSNASICFFEEQKTHSILRQCSVPSELEDKEQRGEANAGAGLGVSYPLENQLHRACCIYADSNMVAGTVTATTTWKLVTFESPVSPNPVVFTGLLHPLDTFGEVQVTGVTETGFHIRLAVDHCRLGYAPAYAQVSWLAASEEIFTIPNSGTSIRVATVDISVGESVDVLPGFKLRTSSNIPTNLPPTEIPLLKLVQLTTTSATIYLESTSTEVKPIKYTLGYLYMDAVPESLCPLGCKTNNLTLDTRMVKVHAGWSVDVQYSTELFGDRFPLIFGSWVVRKTDHIKMVVKEKVEGSSSWSPTIFVVSNGSCTDFVFEEAPRHYGSSLLAALQIKHHFTPNCAEAKSKVETATDAECVAECTALSGTCPPPVAWECFVAAASAELKAKCYVEASVDTAGSASTTTTPPPVGASVQCRVVDMSSYPDLGWDVDAMSCSCPQGFSPCTQHQVEQDRAHWIQDVSPWGSLCRTWEAVQPVARGFMQVASDLCTASSNLRWQQRELPLYSLDDVVLNGRVNKSGYNQCVADTPFVFCPSASLTTTTSTAAPTWDWPQNADCLPGDWSEWSDCSATCTPSEEKLVFAEAGGACSELELKEYDESRCKEQDDTNSKPPVAASALQLGSQDDGTDNSLIWCLLNGRKAKRYRFSIKKDTATGFQPAYYSTQSEDCPDALEPCRDDRQPSCDDLVPVHDILEERQFCKEQCEKIIAACSEESKVNGQTTLQCFADYVVENQPVGGKCTYSQRLVKETATPVCFPSFSRTNDDENSEFRFLDPNSSSMQCLCLTPNSIPCTAKEVFESRLLSLATASSCPSQDTAGASFSAETPGTADSKLFFAAADSAKVFCPLSNSRDFQQPEDAATYSVFKSAAEMNDYCKNGLESQHGLSASTPYDVNLDCSELMPMTDSVSAEECERQCIEIKDECAATTIDYLSCIATKRETTGFNLQCATKGTLFAGRGIIFCKLVPKNCTYSEWGEWSACSATCRSGVGGVESSVRIRTRQILEPSTAGGEPCRVGGTTGGDANGDGGTVQSEPCSFQEICGTFRISLHEIVTLVVVALRERIENHSDASLTLVITPKPEPSHATWSPDRDDTTTTTQSSTQVDSDVACEIYNMAGVSLPTRYDAIYRTCRCPSYTRPCTIAEAEATRSLWNQSMMALCQEDSVAVIPLTNFGLFDCETRTFKDSVADFNEVTAEDQCSTDQFSSVFCVVADDVETERRQMMITMLIMLLVGTFVGIALVLWFIQHSVDVQKVLGLRGRYVELVNMVKE
ncbi:thrombospondin type 1 domain-containing protein, putative [Eimeria mitis]|uniref:Thrombospondin type 1 domain-containing protein, putative n=1 Tax=Eimeria mitis TaxID=44415 RepID=U6KDW5_9EIME|nr:thrombospondin type 1 domain-containing protein, putative [Eimeria mitis]CDJ36144.1 thrombospondin type 1 domain-containing protein, putative [Eimeria mitis]